MKRMALALSALALISATPAFACDADKDAHKDGHGGWMMKKLDTDGDGRISKAEHDAAHEKRFAKLDKNGDGYIDETERKAMFEKKGKGD